MLAYRPDSSELGPGVLVSAFQVIPNADGSYRAPYSQTGTNYGAEGFTTTVGDVKDCFFGRKTDGSPRLFMADATKIYEANTATQQFVDVSGSAYNSAVSWDFCQIRDDTIACSKENYTQRSSSGSFSQLVSIKAKICETMEDALILCNYDDGTDYSDGIAISDVGNIGQFTPDQNLATLAYRTRITSMPGEITAAIRFRNYIVIFKRRGMWLLQYVGAPKIWDVQLFSAEVGCLGKEACRVANDRLFFVDDNNAWVFDGATLNSFSDPEHVTKTMLTTVLGTTSEIKFTEVHYDDKGKLISIYPLRTHTQYYTYNLVSNKWGIASAAGAGGFNSPQCMLHAPFEAVISFTALGVTSAAGENRFSFGTSSNSTFFGNGHAAAAGSAVTAFFGSFGQVSLMRRIYLQIDSAAGFSVSVIAKRAPISASGNQSACNGVFNTSDMYADLMCRGSFFQVSYALAAATPNFTAWADHSFDLRRSGTR